MHGAFSAIAAPARLVIVVVNKYSMAFCLFDFVVLKFYFYCFS